MAVSTYWKMRRGFVRDTSWQGRPRDLKPAYGMTKQTRTRSSRRYKTATQCHTLTAASCGAEVPSQLSQLSHLSQPPDSTFKDLPCTHALIFGWHPSASTHLKTSKSVRTSQNISKHLKLSKDLNAWRDVKSWNASLIWSVCDVQFHQPRDKHCVHDLERCTDICWHHNIKFLEVARRVKKLFGSFVLPWRAKSWEWSKSWEETSLDNQYVRSFFGQFPIFSLLVFFGMRASFLGKSCLKLHVLALSLVGCSIPEWWLWQYWKLK